MPSPDKQIYYQLINTRLDELNQEDDLGHSSQAVVALDQQSVGRLSRMDALQAQAMAQAAQTRRDTQRSALLNARKRLDDNAFGTCYDCGDDIAPKRLAFNPAVQLCLSCASG